MNRNKITSYIYAKDNNKPHLMKDIFTNLSKLSIKLHSNNISFPSETIGLENITSVLINDFNKTYENVYTLCFEDTIIEKKNSLECKWLVVMNEKDSKNIRIGHGLYTWDFNSDDNFVSSLNITIDEMIILEEKYNYEIFDWIKQLPYPWCRKINASVSIPKREELASVIDMIKDSE